MRGSFENLEVKLEVTVSKIENVSALFFTILRFKYSMHLGTSDRASITE